MPKKRVGVIKNIRKVSVKKVTWYLEMLTDELMSDKLKFKKLK